MKPWHSHRSQVHLIASNLLAIRHPTGMQRMHPSRAQMHFNHATRGIDCAASVAHLPVDAPVLPVAIDIASTQFHLHAFTRCATPLLRANHYHSILIERGEIGLQPMFNLALHGHQPVAFPVHIGKFGDHKPPMAG